MKITKTQLLQIIKEEMQSFLSERDFLDMNSPSRMPGMETIMSNPSSHPKIRAIYEPLQPGEFTVVDGGLYVRTKEGAVFMAQDFFDDMNDPEGRKRARDPKRQRAQSAEKELLAQGYTKV